MMSKKDELWLSASHHEAGHVVATLLSGGWVREVVLQHHNWSTPGGWTVPMGIGDDPRRAAVVIAAGEAAQRLWSAQTLGAPESWGCDGDAVLLNAARKEGWGIWSRPSINDLVRQAEKLLRPEWAKVEKWAAKLAARGTIHDIKKL